MKLDLSISEIRLLEKGLDLIIKDLDCNARFTNETVETYNNVKILKNKIKIEIEPLNKLYLKLESKFHKTLEADLIKVLKEYPGESEIFIYYPREKELKRLDFKCDINNRLENELILALGEESIHIV